MTDTDRRTQARAILAKFRGADAADKSAWDEAEQAIVSAMEQHWNDALEVAKAVVVKNFGPPIFDPEPFRPHPDEPNA